MISKFFRAAVETVKTLLQARPLNEAGGLTDRFDFNSVPDPARYSWAGDMVASALTPGMEEHYKERGYAFGAPHHPNTGPKDLSVGLQPDDPRQQEYTAKRLDLHIGIYKPR